MVQHRPFKDGSAALHFNHASHSDKLEWRATNFGEKTPQGVGELQIVDINGNFGSDEIH